MTFNYSSLFNRRGWKASILCGVYVTNNLIRNGAPKACIGPTGSIDLSEQHAGAVVRPEAAVRTLRLPASARSDARPNVRSCPILLQKSAIEERGIFRDFLRPFVATCSI